MTQKITVFLSDATAEKFQRLVPAHEQNEFVEQLFESRFAYDGLDLAEIGRAVTAEEMADPEILADMAAWHGASFVK